MKEQEKGRKEEREEEGERKGLEEKKYKQLTCFQILPPLVLTSSWGLHWSTVHLQ